MLLYSQSKELFISFREGLGNCQLCCDLESDFSLRESHSRSRAIFVVHGLTPRVPTAWQPVGPEAIVAIDRDLSTHHFRWTLP
jgi:hypothetical protein